MIEETLYSYLSGHAGLSALVGNRIYPVVAPQGVTKPYCVCKKVSNARQYAMGGIVAAQRHRFQVSCFGTTYSSAKNVAAQVTAALEAWKAAEVLAAFAINEIDMYEQDTGLYHIPVDFYIWGT